VNATVAHGNGGGASANDGACSNAASSSVSANDVHDDPGPAQHWS